MEQHHIFTQMALNAWEMQISNKLSVLLNRTSHVAYHLGQMVLAK